MIHEDCFRTDNDPFGNCEQTRRPLSSEGLYQKEIRSKLKIVGNTARTDVVVYTENNICATEELVANLARTFQVLQYQMISIAGFFLGLLVSFAIIEPH